MQKGSTLFLRAAVLGIGLIVLALCLFTLPAGIRDTNVGGYRFILYGLYVTTVPFFIALYEAMKLLDYIDQNTAFSELSVKALTNIKNCAITISALFAVGMPYIYVVANRDDAPGVVAIGLVLMGTSAVIATFAAVLQKLLKNAIDLKSEIDLTV